METAAGVFRHAARGDVLFDRFAGVERFHRRVSGFARLLWRYALLDGGSHHRRNLGRDLHALDDPPGDLRRADQPGKRAIGGPQRTGNLPAYADFISDRADGRLSASVFTAYKAGGRIEPEKNRDGDFYAGEQRPRA